MSGSYGPRYRSSTSIELQGAEPDPAEFNFLSFLATAQALQIEFLPIVRDAAREAIGTGATSQIHEAPVDLDTSFAFKACHMDPKKKTSPALETENKIFQNLINEITVLSQPFIRDHANIGQLQGICWDISHIDDKPWPILVFEKSHLGDLDHFARHGGRDMKIGERLRLCLDIGRAVIDMHANGIIHGDIKPENVLIFKEKLGGYSARVIDFGYAARYTDKNHRFGLFGTELWRAPESGRAREWTQSEAKRVDLFSFGMLCLWVLFEPWLSGTIPLPSALAAANIECSSKASVTLSKLKIELQKHAQQLLDAETAFGHDETRALKAFFDSSLSQEPEEREMSLSALLGMLDPERATPYETTLGNIGYIQSSDFKIENSIYDLYRTDYRVRSHIAQCLLEKSSQSMSTALQAALCYYLGFGVTRNEAKAEELLGQGNHSIQVIKDILSTLHPKQNTFQASTRSRLTVLGHMPWSDFTLLYLEQDGLNKAIKRISQEIDDLSTVCGNDDLLLIISRHMLGRIYTIQGRWTEAEQLEVEVIKTSKAKLGEDHPETLRAITNLAITYWNLGRWEEAEKLQVEVMETRKAKLGADHPSTLTSMNNLASTYRDQGRWEKAEELQAKGRWKEAENLDIEVIKIRKTKLGSEHPDTLTSTINLATTYWNRGQFKLAEELEVKAMETSKAKFGADHPETLRVIANLASTYRDQVKLGADHPFTLTVMANLALTYNNQDRWEEAEQLQRKVAEMMKAKIGADHPDTLIGLANLASTYMGQGQWKKAEELLIQVVKTSEAKLRANHPDTLMCMADLASVYREQDRWKAAEELDVRG
ncbi:uncharacterized protein PAC_18696 [Phialocephala subalpina]|uniref:Protein kinase domain-containing protein n=1 Tax=Phialocephala subalpina TaxID=576137 RepID=A0A1L7XUV1_9HELO|nr:uncharacterized protein PAC_18696 [Phialocephala subalpina]